MERVDNNTYLNTEGWFSLTFFNLVSNFAHYYDYYFLKHPELQREREARRQDLKSWLYDGIVTRTNFSRARQLGRCFAMQRPCKILSGGEMSKIYTAAKIDFLNLR